MSYELKIKAKHLGEEIKIIKEEIRKTGKKVSKLVKEDLHEAAANHTKKINSLHYHNKYYPKLECRATHLARAYMKGKRYDDVENPDKRKADKEWTFRMHVPKRVTAMVQKYHDKNVTETDIKNWIGI